MATWSLKRRPDGLVAVCHKYRLEPKYQDYQIFDCGAEPESDLNDALDWAVKEAVQCDKIVLDEKVVGYRLPQPTFVV
jgi:hypothetical protein